MLTIQKIKRKRAKVIYLFESQIMFTKKLFYCIIAYKTIFLSIRYDFKNSLYSQFRPFFS